MSGFDRWVPPLDQHQKIARSWAFKRFRRFHSEINDMYWAMVASSKVAFSNTRGYAKKDSMLAAFNFEAKDVGYREITLEEWGKRLRDFQNWSRLNVLMALSSYFENYLQAIGNLSLESNPGLLFKTSRVLDGVRLLKREKRYVFIEKTIDLVKGSWPARISAFQRLFNGCPSKLEESLGELEKIRLIRNSIGHAFGRTLSTKDLLEVVYYHPMERVSEKRLKRWLGLVFEIANEIDTFLLREHIGAYELVRYYHYWYKEFGYPIAGSRNPNHRRQLNADRFKRYLSEKLVKVWGGPLPSQKYLMGLVDYYSEIQ